MLLSASKIGAAQPTLTFEISLYIVLPDDVGLRTNAPRNGCDVSISDMWPTGLTIQKRASGKLAALRPK